jgi:hypothetical protein
MLAVDRHRLRLDLLLGAAMAAHLKTFAEFPPVQGGKSFDMSNVVQEFINNPRQ